MDISEVNPGQELVSAQAVGGLHAPEMNPARPDVAPTSAPDFRLERMVLIDSYSPGGETIVDLANGTIITGENGSGKTSLIRLIPIFFGESPADISVGTECFSDFYLARSTSYIIFEYRRRNTRCLAVLYANSDGAFNYRFVRAGYDLSFFTAEDGKTLIQSNALSTHLKTLGVIHSNAFKKSEYQAIIQGRLISGKDANRRRGILLDYAFTAGNQRLDHIDKIVGSMFRRQADFKDFLRMTVAYISPDDDKSIALLGDRSRVEKWPEHYAAYQDVMRHRDRMEELTALGAKLSANEGALSDLHARLLVFRDHFTAQAERLDGVHKEEREKLANQEEAHREATEKLSGKAAAAAAEAQVLEAQMAALNEQNRAYVEEKIESKAAVVAKLGENRAKQSLLQERKRILVGAQGEIESRFGQLKLNIETAYLRKVEAANGSKEAIAKKYEPRIEALAKDHQHASNELREKAEVAREAVQKKLNAAFNDKATLDAAIANPAADPLLVAAAEEKREREDAAATKHQEAITALQKADAARIAAREAYDRHETVTMAAGARAIAEEEAVVKALRATAAPVAGSLLGFLREHRPGWTEDIAKVIDPTLLERTDLAPATTEEENAGLFGLTLDLSRIHAPLFADEEALQAAIASKEENLRLLKNDQEAAEAELVRLNRIRSEKAEAHALRHSEEEVARRTHLTTTAERKFADQQVRESKAAAAKAAANALIGVKQRIEEGEGAINDLRKNLKIDLDAGAQQHAKALEALDNYRRAEIEAIDENLATAKEETNRQLQNIDADRLAALSDKGVDTKSLEKIDKELGACAIEIANGEEWSERVLKWKLWLETQWETRVKQQESAENLRKIEQRANRQLETANQAWATTRAELTRKLQDIASGAKEAREQARQADIHLQSVNDYPASAAVLAGGYELVWTLESLGRSKLMLVNEHGQLITEIRSRVRDIKNAFRKGKGSPVEQYFETIEAQIDPGDDNPAAWVGPLRQWYESRHEEFLRTLLLEAQAFGRLINAFHGKIVGFNHRVADFNRKIRDALQSTLHFERISNIDIAFVSTIERKAYWGPIETFVQKHKAWVNGLGRNLPDPSFSEDLRGLMEHWEIKSGIRTEQLELIDVRGEVVENGKKKAFVDAKGLRDLSSNGLSYLILTTISVAFLRMIRGKAKAQLTLAVDELLDLDVRNIGILVRMLRDNGIDLVSACPDADVDVMANFPNIYRVDRDAQGPCLQRADLDEEGLFHV